MCEEWDDEVAERFLIEYRRHECLWNPFHAAFTDCYARTEALTKIVSALSDESINFKGCLRLIRAIREKYVREQTKALRNSCCHSEQFRPGWQRIVEAMLEKIVRDEERVEEISCRQRRGRQQQQQQQQQTTTTRVKTLFRHTISSSARRKDAGDPEGVDCCTKNPSIVQTVPLGKGRRKKRGRKKNRSKLENITRFCSEAGTTKEKDTCKPSDCARPSTAWTRQRDSYLDNLTWTTRNCARTVECPAYASHLDRLSRVENICNKDPCAISTGNYGCSNRPIQCSQRTNCGEQRKKISDIRPTMPCEPKSNRSRQGSSAGSRRPPCSRDRQIVTCPVAKKQNDKLAVETCDKMTECCPCPDKRETEKCKDQCENVCEKEAPKPKTPESCTKDTCPSYQSRCAKTDRPSSRDKPCPAPVATTDLTVLDQSRNVHFDAQNNLQSCTYAPRVAARFENGVLEAYSQFKVVFPSPSQSNNGTTSGSSEKKRRCAIATGSPCESPRKTSRRVQTDKTTRDFAAGVTDDEFKSSKSGRRNKNCCATKCSSRRDMCVGPDEDDVVECCQDDADAGILEPGKTIHNFVLLTPGGKYVPLVRTRSDSVEKVAFTECCVDGGRAQQQRVPETCDNASSRTREKQAQQNVLEDDKCASSTTKLLLRCLEQMLNLEEQEEKAKPVDTTKDDCEPCKRAKDLQKPPPCRADKPTTEKTTSSCSPRGKLTQNFLEILRCALDLDNGKKDYDCDDDALQKQDCCECDAVVNKVERPTPENTCELGLQNKKACCNDQSVQCDMVEEPCAAKNTQTTPSGAGGIPQPRNILSSTRFDHQNQSTPREIPVIRVDDCTIPPSGIESSRLQQSYQMPNSPVHNRTPLLWKTSKRRIQEISKDGQYLRVDTISALKEASTGDTCINRDFQDAGVQEKTLCSSKGTQYESRISPKSVKDTTKASVGTQKRDTVLEYLVRCANRPELPRTSPPSSPRVSTNPSHHHRQHQQTITRSRSLRRSRTDDTQQQQQQQLCDDCQDGVKYVKCNQVYRSFIVRSPTKEGCEEEGPEVTQQYHRRICALKKVYK